MNSLKAVLALILATLIVGCDQSHNSSEPARLGTEARVFDAKANFDLLNTPQEDLPEALQTHLARLLMRKQPDQFRPTLTQRSRTSHGTVWAFVNNSAICLAQGGFGSVACSNWNPGLNKGVILGTFTPPSGRIKRPHDFLVLGLVPNGVGRVLLTVGGRRHRVAVVSHNVFTATGDAPILVARLIRQKT
jgi:hypothetical protein